MGQNTIIATNSTPKRKQIISSRKSIAQSLFMMSMCSRIVTSFSPLVVRGVPSSSSFQHLVVAASHRGRFASLHKNVPSSLWGGITAKSFCSNDNSSNRQTPILMMTSDDDEEETKTWNIPGLKKETSRLSLRCLKKITKASTRYNKVLEEVEELRTNPETTLEQLEACPDVASLERDLNALRERLQKLQSLEELLSSTYTGKKGKSGTSVELPEGEIRDLVLDLEVGDAPPQKQSRGPKKKKGPRTTAPRKPYFRYYSKDKTEIRVGRRSTDNDELSCNPEHRDGADWWMHASGCPGSHIVIRTHENTLEEEVVMDAASLAARQSKCTGNVIKVSLTRCRDVKKPPGAKAGLVQLVGKVRTVSVDMKRAEVRLKRLDESCTDNPNLNN